MSILKYLKPSPKQDSTHDGLLNPHGSLSASLSSATIASANERVREVQQAPQRKSRQPYHKLTPAMRARIGKYACEHGVATATRHCSRELEKPLNESTVRGLKNAYLMEVGLKRRAREADLTVDKLNLAKRGRRLLGEQIDELVKHYLHKLRDCDRYRWCNRNHTRLI